MLVNRNKQGRCRRLWALPSSATCDSDNMARLNGKTDVVQSNMSSPPNRPNDKYISHGSENIKVCWNRTCTGRSRNSVQSFRAWPTLLERGRHLLERFPLESR